MSEPELKVRLRDGELVLVGPSGQELKVRHTLAMGQLAMNVLSAMHEYAPGARAPLGSLANPLQSMVDDWQRKGGTPQRLAERGAAKVKAVSGNFDGTLEDLGL